NNTPLKKKFRKHKKYQTPKQTRITKKNPKTRSPWVRTTLSPRERDFTRRLTAEVFSENQPATTVYLYDDSHQLYQPTNRDEIKESPDAILKKLDRPSAEQFEAISTITPSIVQE